MPQLIEYPAWVGHVNAELDRLSAGLFSAEDFDYPWIEKFQAGVTAGDAAKEALESDGFIVERLAAAVMLLYPRRPAPCPA
ncbi:MAG: hypothetical protein BroJett011_76420 [Chloroflexota bacterium]|nr:MAG: hypothetical protein BroJett011_76420 [Chloroflexota bacterium]